MNYLFELVVARPRTLPQHTLPLLPLLRSRPGGVHKASVVRSPGSDKRAVCRTLVCRIRAKESSSESNQKEPSQTSDLGLAMGEYTQQGNNSKMQQDVSNDRDDDWKQQRVTPVGARA